MGSPAVIHSMNANATVRQETVTPEEERAGIERAFDVIRNHTVHTKGYVMTALKVIEEYGNETEKALLADLLREKGQPLELATSVPPVPKKKKPAKKK
jgi:hypothetical protein